jgi:hypothetical protein
VTVIDGRNFSVVGEVKVGLGPGHIAFDPEAGLLTLRNTVSNDVTVIDTANHEVAAIPAGAARIPAHRMRGWSQAGTPPILRRRFDRVGLPNHRVVATIPVGYLSALFCAQSGWKMDCRRIRANRASVSSTPTNANHGATHGWRRAGSLGVQSDADYSLSAAKARTRSQ